MFTGYVHGKFATNKVNGFSCYVFLSVVPFDTSLERHTDEQEKGKESKKERERDVKSI